MHSRRSVLSTMLTTAAVGAAGTLLPAISSSRRSRAVAQDTFPTTRNVFQWPFAATSIWNRPMGSGAVFHDPQIDPLVWFSGGYWEEYDIIVLTPDAPITQLSYNPGSFDTTPDRCPVQTPPAGRNLPFPVPMSSDFVYHEGSNANEVKFNGCAAILLQDGRTLIHPYTFARCTAGAPPVCRRHHRDDGWPRSQYNQGADIFGPGRFGSHGGTHLSALGGTLRLGELRPGSGHVRHVIGIDLPHIRMFHPTGFSEPYRENFAYTTDTHWIWPAFNADAADSYQGTDIYVRAGMLLALPPTYEIDAYVWETEPGYELAWTAQNYGFQQCDCGTIPVAYLRTEYSPFGTFRQQFMNDWGWDMHQSGPNISRVGTTNDKKWLRDLDEIFRNLHVVINNTDVTPTGGGDARQPLAPPFA